MKAPAFLRSRTFLIVAALALVLAAGNGAIAGAIAARSHPRATNWPAEALRFWPERDWKEVEHAIRDLPSSSRLERGSLGTASYRGSSYPVHLLFFAARRRPEEARVLLVGSVHGTEPAGGQALLELARRLASDPNLLPNVAIDIVPIANPWGWVYGYRYTGNGADINRDFASNRTQEAGLLRGLIGSRGPYDLVMDLHESKKPGYFLYEYLPLKESFGPSFARLVEGMGKPLEDRYRELLWQAEDGILHIPTVALAWVWMARQLSLEHYARLHGTRHAYTVETPVEEPITDRVAIDLAAVKLFADLVVDRREARR